MSKKTQAGLGLVKASQKRFFTLAAISIFMSNAPVYANQIYSFPEILPDNFRGKIVYDGAVEAIITPALVKTAATSVDDKKNVHGDITGATRSQGNYHTEIDYDGNKLSGSYFIPEAPEVATKFTGVRQGDSCIITDENNNEFRSKCTSKEFTSELVYWDDSGKMFELYVQASSTKLIKRR